jgi:hypothetical protein
MLLGGGRVECCDPQKNEKEGFEVMAVRMRYGSQHPERQEMRRPSAMGGAGGCYRVIPDGKVQIDQKSALRAAGNVNHYVEEGHIPMQDAVRLQQNAVASIVLARSM